MTYSKNMIKLSLCMIVKNEEETLDRCLTCAKQFADEIIVVDTGSTDSTKEIAKKYTNHIFDFVWNDDFSDARNFSLEKASGEYLMWLDADDIVSDENIKKINKLKQNLVADIYMLKYVIAFDEMNNPTFSYYRERIFKRSLGYRFVGFIHEAIPAFGRIEYLDIEIFHKKIKHSDPKRNLKIYKKKIKEGLILSSRETFYLARELFYNAQYKNCIQTMKTYLKMDNLFLPNVIDAHKIISDCYVHLGDNKNALKTLLNSMNFSSPNAEICCRLGELFMQQNLDEAKFWFKCALMCEKEHEKGAFVEDAYYDFIPYIQLSVICYMQNNLELSRFYHEKAKQINPNHQSIQHNEKFLY